MIKIKEEEIKSGIKILELLSLNKIVSSKSEGRRVIKNKGIKIDNLALEDENKIIDKNVFNNKKVIKISLKKKHYLVKIRLFDFSRAFVINLGVKVLLINCVLILPGGPFILKLTPNNPSPTSLGIIISPIVSLIKMYLNFLPELRFLLN